MGCRPSKQAVSKVRALEDTKCLCSPHKVRKNHKCSDSTGKAKLSFKSNQSSSSGQKPLLQNFNSVEFPAFSTTSAVYRKSASKTSKITLRLSCDGSMLEIEQCEYDLEKTQGYIYSQLRAWRSAPNLTRVTDCNFPLVRQNPTLHSTFVNTSNTFLCCNNNCLHIPVGGSLKKEQSKYSSTSPVRYFKDFQTHDSSSRERVNADQSSLKIDCKQYSDTAPLRPSKSSNPSAKDAVNRFLSENHFIKPETINKKEVHGTTMQLRKKNRVLSNRKAGDIKFSDDSGSELIPVNIITSYSTAEVNNKIQGHNHELAHSTFSCQCDVNAESKKHLSESDKCLKPVFCNFLEILNVSNSNHYSDKDDIMLEIPTDCSPVKSKTIKSFFCSLDNKSPSMPLCSNGNETINRLYVSQPNIVEKCSVMNDEKTVHNYFQGRIIKTLGLIGNPVNDDALSRSKRSRTNNVRSMHKSSTCLKHLQGDELKKDSEHEWIDGELMRVAKYGSDTNVSPDNWARITFPQLKMHVSATSLLSETEEHDHEVVTNHVQSPSRHACHSGEIVDNKSNMPQNSRNTLNDLIDVKNNNISLIRKLKANSFNLVDSKFMKSTAIGSTNSSKFYDDELKIKELCRLSNKFLLEDCAKVIAFLKNELTMKGYSNNSLSVNVKQINDLVETFSSVEEASKRIDPILKYKKTKKPFIRNVTFCIFKEKDTLKSSVRLINQDFDTTKHKSTKYLLVPRDFYLQDKSDLFKDTLKHHNASYLLEQLLPCSNSESFSSTTSQNINKNVSTAINISVITLNIVKQNLNDLNLF